MHSYQPTAADMRAIENCNLFIHIGGISDVWSKKLSALDSIALIDHLPMRENDRAQDADAEACEHGHSHHICAQAPQTSQDEHIWLSLRDAETCVLILANRIAELDPAGANEYRANARKYMAELQALDYDFSRFLANNDRKPLLFADRFPFSRLADDYSLDCISAFHGCCADAEASFHTIEHLAKEIDEHSIKAIFVLEQGNVRLAEAIRSATAAKDQQIVVLDSMQAPAKSSYIDTMRRNFATISEIMAQ